mmetsp:Transcript_39241/g.94912  ORF Transcript_39241/g.94912 Transcript_39241/m.94912 type:complete len:206 (+) Transcript_39241:1119-1736(+)
MKILNNWMVSSVEVLQSVMTPWSTLMKTISPSGSWNVPVMEKLSSLNSLKITTKEPLSNGVSTIVPMQPFRTAMLNTMSLTTRLASLPHSAGMGKPLSHCMSISASWNHTMIVMCVPLPTNPWTTSCSTPTTLLATVLVIMIPISFLSRMLPLNLRRFLLPILQGWRRTPMWIQNCQVLPQTATNLLPPLEMVVPLVPLMEITRP